MFAVFLLVVLQTYETAVCHLQQMPCLLRWNLAMISAVVVVVAMVILVVRTSNSARVYSCVKEVHPAAAAVGIVSPRLPSKRDDRCRNHQWY